MATSWTVQPYEWDEGRSLVIMDRDLVVARIEPIEGRGLEPDDYRRAVLLSAAPVLLAALEALMVVRLIECDCDDGSCLYCKTVVAARAAIDKATGNA
jgi:hypothetical protein